MAEPLSTSEQRALGVMGREWLTERFSGGLDGEWRRDPAYLEAVAAVETATDRAAREARTLTERHNRERAALEAKHEGHL